MGLPGFSFLGFPEDAQEINSAESMSMIMMICRITYFRAK
jgi:hypothetical protein